MCLAGASAGADKKDADKESFTFVQITDSHIFDSGKARKNQTPQQLRMNLVEIADSRAAWDWAFLEINRLAVAGPLDFVAFTGDFGLEKVTTNDPPPAGCIARSSALDDAARAFGGLLVDKVYMVRGNNDLDEENPQDAGRFDDFVEALANDARLRGKLKIVNLTPALGNAITATDMVKGVRIVGLDSSSFKAALPLAASSSSSASANASTSACPYNVPVNTTARYQENELKRVSKFIDASNTPVLLFTHIPDLDDPYKLSNPSAAAAWQLGTNERNEWNKIVIDRRLLAVFAGHLHDSTRSRYLPPFSWQANRSARPVDVYEKTYLSPPLAAKFQMESAPQARGYLLVSMTAQGVQRAEIRWYSANLCDAIVAPPPGRADDTRCPSWKCAAYWGGIAVAGVLVLVVVFLLLTRRVSSLLQVVTSAGLRQFFLVAGSAALSLLLIAIAKTQLEIGESATLIALMLIPLLVYGVVSGRLTGLKAPGGWEATFQKIAAQSVEVKGVAIEDTVMVDKIGPRETLQQFEMTQPGKPVVMTLRLGTAAQKQYYTADAVGEVMEKASEHPEFKFVLILDQHEKAICYAPVNRFKAEIRRDAMRSKKFIDAINSGDEKEVREFPGMCTETVSRTTSNGEALELAQKLGFDAILATENGKPIGVVECQHIINQIVATLARRASN
jgi:hypothetical protein